MYLVSIDQAMIPDIVTISDVNIDIFTDQIALDLMKQIEIEFISKGFFISLRGNAENFAMAIAKLGLKSWLICQC